MQCRVCDDDYTIDTFCRECDRDKRELEAKISVWGPNQHTVGGLLLTRWARRTYLEIFGNKAWVKFARLRT